MKDMDLAAAAEEALVFKVMICLLGYFKEQLIINLLL